jgi:hypothetical protein
MFASPRKQTNSGRVRYVRFALKATIAQQNATRRLAKCKQCAVGGTITMAITNGATGSAAVRAPAVRSKNDLDVKEIVNLWAGGSAAVKSMLGRH